MTAYNDFVVKYEGGMTIMEIVAESDISRRTAYRYKAYYDKLKDAGKNLLYDSLNPSNSTGLNYHIEDFFPHLLACHNRLYIGMLFFY